MIRFACPGCGKTYKAADELAGRKTACKSCAAVVLIPERLIQEVLYGIALPPEGVVDNTPEPDPLPKRERQAPPRDDCDFNADQAEPRATRKRNRARRESEQDNEPIRAVRSNTKIYLILAVCIVAISSFSICAGLVVLEAIREALIL